MNTLNVVESIFFVALDKPTPEDRAAYLDEACKGDANLRRCVERLLGAQPKLDGFLQPPPVPPAGEGDDKPATIDQPTIEERPGTIIGPFKLLQQLGEGGFGVVFLAEQEQPVRRKIALKIIKPGMDSKQVVARFEAERQALAMMDHPNIARVLDGGATESGRPYFVMELVKGVPITEFCDKNRLTPRERLELFIPVCQAVQHAHQKGIIHRDIKPSNVLVTMYDDKPVPKVIDFGIAKAIEQKLTEQTLFTRVGQIVGTLEYMSPEQASLNALDVDTRADVYALGVLLYELLTGTTPLDKQQLQKVAFLEMLRLIREEEPPKPSTRLSQSADGLPLFANYRNTDSQKLPRLVRGELDWITMKALEKDRARRYAAASALAADVQRYLKDEPVEACPPTLSYRAQKFVRKHKSAFVTAAACTALLLLGTTVSLWQAVRATRFLNETETARQAEAEQRAIAVKREKEAERERDAVKAARETLRRKNYAATMNLIPTTWEADNVGRVLDLLDGVRPKDGEPDLRSFEWDYWDRLCHGERRQLLNLDSDTPVRDLTLSGDGTRVAFWMHGTISPREAFQHVKLVDVASGKEVRSWKVSSDSDQTLGYLSLNQDGSRVAFASKRKLGSPAILWNAQLFVWDADTGKKIFAPQGQFGTLVLSADGKLLATSENVGSTGKSKGLIGGPSSPAQIKIWDLSDPREPVNLELVNYSLNPAKFEFSADGSRLAVISQGSSYSKLGFGFAGLKRTEADLELFYTRDGKRCASIAIPKSDDGNAPRSSSSSSGSPLSIRFSADGTHLATAWARVARDGGEGSKVYVWDGAAANDLKFVCAATLPTVGRVTSLAFSPDRRYFVVCGMASAARLVDAESGAEWQVFKSRVDVGSAVFSADGARLVLAGIGGRSNYAAVVQEWDVVTGDAVPSDREPTTTIHSPDGSRQAVYSKRSSPKNRLSVSIRNRAGNELGTYGVHDRGLLVDVELSRDGSLVLSRTASEAIVWESDSGVIRRRVEFEKGAPLRPAASRDGRFLAWPDSDEVKIAEFSTLRELFAIPAPSCYHVDFSPDGRRLVFLRADAAENKDSEERIVAVLWDVDTRRQIAAIPLTPDLVVHRPNRVEFSPDSRWFVLLDSLPSPRVRLATVFDAATGAPRFTAQGDTGKSFIGFSPDGARFTLGTNGNIYLRPLNGPTVWDVGSGKLLYRLDGHAGIVKVVLFSPDGKRIVTGATQSTRLEIKLWDAATGHELLSLKAALPPNFTDDVLSFSPDGHRLIFAVRAVPPRAIQTIWDGTPRTK